MSTDQNRHKKQSRHKINMDEQDGQDMGKEEGIASRKERRGRKEGGRRQRRELGIFVFLCVLWLIVLFFDHD